MSREPVIRIEKLKKALGGKPVLCGIDLDIEQGEVLVVIGRSGSGKSTLIRCINLLEVPDEGKILFEGKPVHTGPGIDRYRSQVGMVFQRFNLFPHMTVLRNLTLAPVLVGGVSLEDAKARARGLLEQVGLADRQDAYPGELSGGQQQRVAIARALAMQPRVMLFDEVTSALDPELVREVLDVMKSLAKAGMTMVVVTHHMSFAREVGRRIAFLEHGCIAELGPAEEVLDRPRHPGLREFLRHIL
jgi:ABC-type polar amino acid transport system ATPase subunit